MHDTSPVGPRAPYTEPQSKSPNVLPLVAPEPERALQKIDLAAARTLLRELGVCPNITVPTPTSHGAQHAQVFGWRGSGVALV